MESFIPSVEAIFVERAKHPVFLVGAVEESANVTLSGKIAPGKLHGMTLGRHISPHTHSRHATESTIANAHHMLTLMAFRNQERRTEQKKEFEYGGADGHGSPSLG